MNENIFLTEILKKFQVLEDEASSSNEPIEHSPSNGPVSKHYKTVTINGVKVWLPENQLNRLLILLSGKTVEDEEGRERLEKIEGKNIWIKER